jgi:PAS domain S-box-containing protein
MIFSGSLYFTFKITILTGKEYSLMRSENSRCILLVEDETLIALTESLILQKNGYRVEIANSGEQAVETALTKKEIDLVLMDINLGTGIDGTEAAQKILEKRDIPLVFLSSHTEEEVVEKTEGITSYGYIVKNSGTTVLLAAIKMAFRLYESRQREQIGQALKTLAETGNGNGEDIFHCIVRELAKALGTRYALAAEVNPEEPEVAYTLAVWNGNGFSDNFKYDLEATPCRNVREQGTCLYPKDVVYRFPEDQLLKDMGAESYWGTPLRDRDGKVLGILAALDTRPMQDQPWFLGVLESFAARVAGEIVRRKNEQVLKEKEKHLAETLSSIGDAVISTDTSGRVLDLNGVAEYLTGWKKEDACGKKISNVFHIVHGRTRKKSVDPVRKALREKAVTGLENHTVLISRSGEERQVADSCAPVLDETGTLLGAVLVFRDVSEEYRKDAEREVLSRTLAERLKELQCLFALSRLTERHDISFRELFQSTIELLVESLQYPELAGASIRIGSTTYETERYDSSQWTVKSRLLAEGAEIGMLEVSYRNDPEEGGESPFLKEEKELIDAVAEQLNLFIQRKYAGMAKKSSEERYHSIFDQGMDGICLVDIKSGRITDCNPALAKMVGRERYALIGQHQKILHPPSREDSPFSPTFLEHLNGKAGEVLESRLLTADGRVLDVEIYANSVEYHGRMVMQGIFRDITERKRAEKKLRFQAHLLDSIGQSVVVTDTAGLIEYWNRAAEQLFGWSAEEVIGRNIIEVIPSEEAAEFASEIMEKLQRGETWSGRFKVKRKDGSTFMAIVSDTPVLDEEGKLTAIIGITTDLSGVEPEQK